MNRDIREELTEARRFSKHHDFIQSLRIYRNIFDNHSHELSANDKRTCCWKIYRAHVKNCTSDEELIEATEFITDVCRQADMNVVNTCPYTLSVLKVFDMLFDKGEFYNCLYWIDKIRPEFLNDEKGMWKGRPTKSRRERFLDRATKALLECEEYDDCIDLCQMALESMDDFINYADTWYRWRIAKSLKALNRHEEALAYLTEVLSVKQEWYMYRDMAEIHCSLGNEDEALENVCCAMLAPGQRQMKVNLYGLVYHLLKDSNPEIALKHAQMYYLLKINTQADIDEEIEDLFIDESEIDGDALEDEITDFWKEFRFKNQKLQYGTVIQYLEDKNYGFIRSDDDESIFFHGSSVSDDEVHIGQYVSFYTERNFDKSKNRQSVKAVNVRGE